MPNANDGSASHKPLDDESLSVTSHTEEPSNSQSHEDLILTPTAEHRPRRDVSVGENGGMTVRGEADVEDRTTGSSHGGDDDADASHRHHLAVAVPVRKQDELDRQRIIPQAQRYDPDDRPTTTDRKRLYYCFGGLICCAVLLCAVAIPLGIMVSKENTDDDVPTPHPREQLGIRQEIERLVGQDKLQVNSPYQKAVDWITLDDPKQLVPADDNFEQRYILAYLYFATTETRPWKSCNPPQQDPTVSSNSNSVRPVESDHSRCTYYALTTIVDGKGKYLPSLATRWLSHREECAWAEVTCDDSNRVVSITLEGQDLNGVFPGGIVHLPRLERLSFKLGEIRGNIPPEIATLGRLVELDLSFNRLSGQIPEEIWGMSELTELLLGYNQLEGNIPTRVGQLTSLRALSLSNLLLPGEIPSDIGKLRNLTDVRLAKAALHGRIPTEIGNLEKLFFVRLNGNDLSGELPSEIAQLSNLSLLHLAGNPLLKGEFPVGIWGKPSVSVIDIRDCSFSGSIGSEVGEMLELQDLWLSYNPLFTGTIPPELGNARKLRSLLIENTNIQGPMPIEVCQRPGTQTFNFEIWADCLGEDPAFECSCCTTCCLRGGIACQPTA